MLSTRPHKKKFWRLFLNDLSYLLPLYGAGLGVYLLLGSAPALGASFLTLGVYMLILRIHSAIAVRRERLLIEYLNRWARTYFPQGRRSVSSREGFESREQPGN